MITVTVTAASASHLYEYETEALREAATAAAIAHQEALSAAAAYETMMAQVNAMIAAQFPDLAAARTAASATAAAYEQAANELRNEVRAAYQDHPEQKTYLGGAANVAMMPATVEIDPVKALKWVVEKKGGAYTKQVLDTAALKAAIKNGDVKAPKSVATVTPRLDVRIDPASLLDYATVTDSSSA